MEWGRLNKEEERKGEEEKLDGCIGRERRGEQRTERIDPCHKECIPTYPAGRFKY